jgi:hypothetical protein
MEVPFLRRCSVDVAALVLDENARPSCAKLAAVDLMGCRLSLGVAASPSAPVGQVKLRAAPLADGGRNLSMLRCSGDSS